MPIPCLFNFSSSFLTILSRYKHAVIQDLVDDTLLRNVRTEIREHISFTPKETDIYKIHQSGDLANLDGLGDSALRKLPSLLTLRDSLYSSAFRKYLSSVTGAGPLSGVKTDMAVVRYSDQVEEGNSC
jgi:Rps23 Pro-64 3,4-dihydroxylase Tpa1-like proline 4-hydroxylase